ncbi:MAG TPA: galactokinase [Longimicrobiales bacterium]
MQRRTSERFASERAMSAFRGVLEGEPVLVSRAPGRINLIGEHVDYSEGFVLPIAIDRDVVVVAAPRPDSEIHAFAADHEQRIRFSAAELGRSVGWQSYVRGAAKLLDEAGIRVPGASLSIAGDIAEGAGLSSSAALVVAVCNALLSLTETRVPPLQLIEIACAVERDFAGVSCGVMDPFASVCGAEDHAIFLDCRSLDYQLVPIPDNVRIIATDSGIRRSLHDTEYNQRVRETRDAARRLGVRTLRDARPDVVEAGSAELGEILHRRAKHVVSEIARTHAAVDALEHGELHRLGDLLSQSHETLRDDYDVSTPEIDALVDIARAIPGVLGSRLTGAGFGGCTVSVVEEDAVDEFLERVPAEYRARTGREAQPHVCRAAPGASVELLDL